MLYRTLGPTLPDGAASAALLWGAAHRCAAANPDGVRRAGFDGEGLEAGEQLFDAILTSRSGVVITEDDDDATWSRVATADGRISLVIPELLDELAALADGGAARIRPRPGRSCCRPASAGRSRPTPSSATRPGASATPPARCGSTPTTPLRLGIDDGGRARLVTRRGEAEVVVEVSDMMQPGHVSLPNGLGLAYPQLDGEAVTGVAPNELTSSDDRDHIAGTPWHKHVPARVEPLISA